ncbi:MAG: RecX family transcriptional regulator [Prevotella sp.]|nr:RecX family transcriptional regulator [Bacteroides sp.]MCM1366441.1 RecX family transcriptional regulator [Prevotella sp.]MCM1437079.1 RecX family transcriptional regulator [Prevotella sp.]
MKTIDYDAAKLRYAGLCARSEQCTFDIIVKARKAGLTSEETDRLIEYLTNHKFIDDRRFAGAYARDKARFSGWGPYKIEAGLRQKRISESYINEAISSVSEEVYANSAAALVKAKLRGIDSVSVLDEKQKGKIIRSVMSRGFSYTMVKEFLPKL